MLKAIHHYTNSTELLTLAVQYQLLNQLKAYGLDPHEWQFESLQWNQGQAQQALAVVTHRNDDNLRLEGVAAKSTAGLCLYEWRDLKWDL